MLENLPWLVPEVQEAMMHYRHHGHSPWSSEYRMTPGKQLHSEPCDNRAILPD